MIKQSKRLIAIILVILISISFSSCNKAPAEEPRGVKIVIDSVGREVEVPNNPKKIAALDSYTGEAMVMIGAGDKMVGVPNGVKMDRLLQEIYPELSNVAVPMSGGAINAETLTSLGVDIVFIKSDVYSNEGEVAKIERLGIPYVVIRYYNMEEQIKALDLIGETIGGEASKKANKINQYYKNVINIAKEISEKIPEEEKVRVYHSINESVRTDGIQSLGDDWVRVTGSINVSTEDSSVASKGDYYASIEQVFSWNPDVIICNENVTKEFLLRDKKWSGLKAVAEKKVYNIPVGATRWGQRGSLETFLAILWLGTTIYPEYYKEIDLKKEVTTFYKDYLGLEIDDETYKEILSGDGIRGKSLDLDK